ncbi:MAG: hypothetical protein P8I93_04700 [Crocinitomicaceae bacterium]|nr:hypothetical protein [Crocinitomicaceae bacterium]
MKLDAKIFLALFYLFAISGLFFFPDRSHFIGLFSFYLISIGIYFFSLKSKQDYLFSTLLGVFFILGIVSVFSIPVLSNDFYRFLWDGELFVKGVNPYGYRPVDYIQQIDFFSAKYYMLLYDGMGSLSQQHYSCYPPVSIYLFGFCAVFTNDLQVNIMVMHVLMLLFQIPGIYFGKKVCEIIGINKKGVFILFLHPLYLIEVLGNLHFEGVMLPLLLTCFYFFHKKLIFISSFFMALAIHIKLIPILFFGAFISCLSFKNLFKFFILSMCLIVFFSIGLMDQNNMFNFLDSLKLYFGKFEFYSFVYVYFQKINSTFFMTFLNIFLLFYAFFRFKKGEFYWYESTPIILIIFYLLSGTVHPWYLLSILLFAPFCKMKTVLVYPSIGFVSYLFYGIGDGYILRLIYMLSYMVILGFLWFDLQAIKRRGSL